VTDLRNELCFFARSGSDVLEGSGIIVPYAHRPTVFDLTSEEWEASFELLAAVKSRLDQELQPDGYNVGYNVGSAGGQDLFHAHMHVIPRFHDEPFAGRGIRYWLKSEANRR
jgi:histidine triad (HIT) family protein